MSYSETILIVEDNESNIDILLDILKDYDVSVAINGEIAIEILQEEKPDIILLDIMMPKLNGYEVCKIIKADSKLKNIPVLFITAKTDEESLLKAFKVGGVDYVIKPFKSNELLARVKTHIKLKKAMDKLSYLANHDEMTGVYNRRYTFLQTNKLFQKAKEDRKNLSVLMLDIDYFKNINDSYGHNIGDEVIIAFSEKIKSLLKENEIFGRIGGEEFLIIIYNKNKNEVRNLAELIRIQIEKLQITQENIKITVSIGVSHLTKEDTTVDSLFKKADIKLYEAKNSSRNRVCD